jgi:hypothetical protein
MRRFIIASSTLRGKLDCTPREAGLPSSVGRLARAPSLPKGGKRVNHSYAAPKGRRRQTWLCRVSYVVIGFSPNQLKSLPTEGMSMWRPAPFG